MKKIIQLKLKILAKMILAKYKPRVIGITGSVGKTSAKEAIYAVLSAQFRARRPLNNYNNEIGLPLAIIGAKSPGKSILGWIDVFFKALGLLLIKNEKYPEILILEMGVDRPGDMKYLLKIVKPEIGVITSIGASHLEYFSSVEQIKEEKRGLIKDLDKDSWVILNYDNELTRNLENKTKAKVITYGFSEPAQVRASELKFSFEEEKEIANLLGMGFKLKYNNQSAKVILNDVLGYSGVYAALAAASVGLALDMDLEKIAQALGNIKLPPGRMNLIAGIKKTMIIDDTYNSSPDSSISALDLISKIPINKDVRKFAILGDMLELGSFSEAGHKQVGKRAVEAGINKLITVGERARDIARGAEEAGLKKDNIFHFPDAVAAGKFAQDRIKEGDIILIKGSQGVRMEKIVKEIMAEPLRAKELLIRQDEQWIE